MTRYRKKTLSGAVCEIEVYNVPERRSFKLKPAPEKIRTAEERAEYKCQRQEPGWIDQFQTACDDRGDRTALEPGTDHDADRHKQT